MTTIAASVEIMAHPWPGLIDGACDLFPDRPAKSGACQRLAVSPQISVNDEFPVFTFRRNFPVEIGIDVVRRADTDAEQRLAACTASQTIRYRSIRRRHDVVSNCIR